MTGVYEGTAKTAPKMRLNLIMNIRYTCKIYIHKIVAERGLTRSAHERSLIPSTVLGLRKTPWQHSVFLNKIDDFLQRSERWQVACGGDWSIMAKLNISGQMTKETVQKENTGAKRELQNKSETEVVGPFCVDEVHAEVEAGTKVTVSANFQSVTIAVSIRIPVAASEEAVKAGLDWCFAQVNEVVNEETKGARELMTGK